MCVSFLLLSCLNYVFWKDTAEDLAEMENFAHKNYLKKKKIEIVNFKLNNRCRQFKRVYQVFFKTYRILYYCGKQNQSYNNEERKQNKKANPGRKQ